MAVTTLALGYKPSKGIDYTHTTDTSADFTSVPNDTFFYNLEDELPYYKDGSGNVLSIFSAGGADGNGIYSGSGTTPIGTKITLGGDDLTLFKSSAYSLHFQRFDDLGVRASLTLGAGSSITAHTPSTSDFIINGQNNSIELNADGKLTLSNSNPRVFVTSQFIVTNLARTSFQHRLYDTSNDSWLVGDGGNLGVGKKTGISAKLHVGGDARVDGECRATTYNVNGTAGASGTFTSNDGKTITVVSGIITSIV